MPLVPLNIVSKWYKSDSWVYRNFKYLFQNQLWENTLPNGFSLCPYFWLSLFSLFIFRPIVGLVLSLRFASNFLRLNKLIRFTDGVFSKLYNIKRPVFCLNTVVGLIFSCFFGGIFALILEGIWIFVKNYMEAGVLISAGILPVVLLLTLVFCADYINQNKSNNDRCRVEWYMRFLTVISLIIAYFINHEEFMGIVVGIPIFAVKGFFILIWLGLTVSFHWITGLFVINTFSLSFLSFAGICIFLYLYMIVASKFTFLAGEPAKSVKEEKFTLNDFKQVFQSSLYSFHYTYYMERKRVVYVLHKEIKELYIKKKETGDMLDFTINEINGLIKIYDDRELQRLKNKALRDEKCKRFTQVFAKLMWPFVQIGTFFALLWELAKAKKQGACPYIKFEK